MSILQINCGNFSSLDNFYQCVGISLKVNKNIKSYDSVHLDCTLLNRTGNIRISVLTSLLSLAYWFKEKYKTACTIGLSNDLSVLQFFKDSNFYYTSKIDGTISWHDYESENSDLLILSKNILCKITSFNELVNFGSNNSSLKTILSHKNKLHDIVPGKILSEFFSILSAAEIRQRKLLINLLTKAITEYVINALIHGKSNSYVGLQISKWGISVCIADSGIGIQKSLKENYNSDWANKVNINNDINAILNASLKQNIDIGLRDTIHKIIEAEGYTVISSGNAEIIWGEGLWANSLRSFDHENYKDTLQDYQIVLPKLKNQVQSTNDLVTYGSYKMFSYSLPGTRVFFEIPNKY